MSVQLLTYLGFLSMIVCVALHSSNLCDPVFNIPERETHAVRMDRLRPFVLHLFESLEDLTICLMKTFPLIT